MRSTKRRREEEEEDAGDGRMKLLIREMDRTKEKENKGGGRKCCARTAFGFSVLAVVLVVRRGGAGRVMREEGREKGEAGGVFNCRNAWCCWG